MSKLIRSVASALPLLLCLALCVSAAEPSPWTGSDVGKVGPAGRFVNQQGQITLFGAGDDIWLGGDSFYYVYRPIKGDAEITAKVASFEAAHAAAKAGVMIRETLSYDSLFLGSFVTPGAGVICQARTGDLENVATAIRKEYKAPCWIKAARTGNKLTAYLSADGKDWVTCDSRTIAMSPYAYIGIGVCGKNPRALGKAVFEQVGVKAEFLPAGADPAELSRPERMARDTSGKPSAELAPLDALYETRRRERAELRFPQKKKLIQFKQSPLDAAYLKTNARKADDLPFDGVVLKFKALRVDYLFRPKKYDETVFVPDYKALAALDCGRRLTDNFILAGCTSQLDWFDDQQWAAVLHNTRIYAKAAVLGRCAGICLDPECYGANPWTYHDAPHRGQYTFEQYQTQVAQRGREWIGTVQQVMPNPRILTLFLTGCQHLVQYQRMNAAQVLQEQKTATKGMQSVYPLLSAFSRGMIEGAEGETLLVDGNESAYYYPVEGDHLQFRKFFDQQQAAALFPGLPVAQYRKHVRAGSALYCDFYFGSYDAGWSKARSLTPEQQRLWAEHNAYWALKTADEYVWDYSDKFNWWTGHVPEGYPEAVRTALRKIESGQDLGFDTKVFGK